MYGWLCIVDRAGPGSLTAASAGLVALGVVAATGIYGVCNENADSSACDLASGHGFRLLLVIVPPVVAVASGILAGRRVLILVTCLLAAGLVLILGAVVASGP
jgi:hypothetical protein